jgi:hypothetical protein
MFRWETAGPYERGDMIRRHRTLSMDQIRHLFQLTDQGVVAILKGANWEPRFSTEERADETV